jgi:sensor histidine kinase YesM
MLKKGRKIKKVNLKGTVYNNYYVTGNNRDIYFGILIPRFSVVKNIPYYMKLIFLIAIFSLILIPVIIYWLQKKIARPLKIVDKAMNYIRKGNMDYRISIAEKNYYDEFDSLISEFNKMMDDINNLQFILYKTKINEQRTELKYISQQIRPHFILNALNIIYTYNIDEFHLAKKMVLYLSEYFRYIINIKVDFVELSEEFRYVDNYMKIQKERYPERFEYFIKAEENVEDCMIPPLIIQTFAENCFKYAIKNKEKLYIHITAQEYEGRLKIKIEDNGNGFSEDALYKLNKFIDTREYQDQLGVGIQNVIERLDILYQKENKIIIKNADTGGAVVELYLPLEI